MLAVRRLSSDTALREQLGRAGTPVATECDACSHAAAAWMHDPAGSGDPSAAAAPR